MNNRFLTDADELDLLRNTARRFFTKATSAPELSEIGFTGLLTTEDAGGSGWLPVEAAVIAEEAGRALSAAPVLGSLLAGAAAAASAPHLVKGVLAGDLVAAVATLPSDGTINAVGAAQPDLVLLAAGGGSLLLLDARDGTVVSPPDPLDTTRPSATVTFSSGAATVLEHSDAARIMDAATLLVGADSLGALAASATLVRGHLSERFAFERPLASFQAIQHRLADLEMLETALRALVQRSAIAVAAGDPRATRMLAALQFATANRVPAAIDECIQLAGGIGFTWEWPLHHAMRRAMVNGPLPQPVAVRRAELVSGGDPEHGIDEGTEAEFRARARAVIRANRPHVAREGHTAPETPQQEQALRVWYRTLFSEGLIGASWPAEHGGDPDHRLIHQLIVTEELIRARAPRPIDQIKLSSHVIIKFGTEEQKARYLPRIREGQDVWCQLFSEPDVGSDLAGIKARAKRRDDGSWVLGGQKTWTTDGHWAQMGIALLRTSSEAKRHAGITAFLVPMDAPQLEIQPKQTIGGAYEFNDVFLDGVVLPADSVLGEVGGGWSIAMAGLEVERLGIGGNVVLLDMLLDDLVAVVQALRSAGRLSVPEAEVEYRISALASEAQLAKAFVADHVDRTLVDAEVAGDGSISKVLYTETYNRIGRYGAELTVGHAPLPDAAIEPSQRLMDAWLWSRSLTISGGSSEVMRNIIAKRRLRLPQD